MARLLSLGYRVRCYTRNPAAASWLQVIYTTHIPHTHTCEEAPHPSTSPDSNGVFPSLPPFLPVTVDGRLRQSESARAADAGCGRYFGVDKSHPWEDILYVTQLAMQACGGTYTLPPRFEGAAATPTQFDHTRRSPSECHYARCSIP